MLRTLFILAILAVGTGAAIYSRFGALLLYLWFAIFRPQEWVWVDLSSLHLSLIIGFVFVIPSLLTGIFPNLFHPLSLGCLLFLGTALVAQTNAIRPDIAWIWIDFFAKLMIVSFLMIRLINTRRRFLATIAVIALSLGFHSAKAGVAYILAGGTLFGEGLGGAFSDNGHYALAIVMILPFLMACAQNTQRKAIRFGLLLAMPLSCLTVIATFERSGFLALVVTVLMYILLQRKRARALALFGGVALVAVLVVPVPKGYLERIETIRTYREINETSALGRLHFWRVATDMAIAHPLGIGLRNFEPLYDTYDTTDGLYGRNRAVHSSHFQVLAENGFIGFAAWLFLFGYSYKVLFRVRRAGARDDLPPEVQLFYFTTANALIISQTAFVVGGAFLSAAHNDLTWYSFALAAALDLLERAERGVEKATAGKPFRADAFSPVLPSTEAA
jgi:putative inorganic carbon (hco3(-)) transporter